MLHGKMYFKQLLTIMIHTLIHIHTLWPSTNHYEPLFQTYSPSLHIITLPNPFKIPLNHHFPLVFPWFPWNSPWFPIGFSPTTPGRGSRTPPPRRPRRSGPRSPAPCPAGRRRPGSSCSLRRWREPAYGASSLWRWRWLIYGFYIWRWCHSAIVP